MRTPDDKSSLVLNSLGNSALARTPDGKSSLVHNSLGNSTSVRTSDDKTGLELNFLFFWGGAIFSLILNCFEIGLNFFQVEVSVLVSYTWHWYT